MNWKDRIREQLSAWRVNPDAIAEDDLIPPSSVAIAKAEELLDEFRCDVKCHPDRDGGVIFSINMGWHIEISETGAVRCLLLRGDEVVACLPVDEGYRHSEITLEDIAVNVSSGAFSTEVPA